MSDHKTFCAVGAYAVDVTDPHATVVMLLANAADLGREIDKDKLKDKFVTLNLHQRLDGTIGTEKVSFEDATLDTLGLFHNGAPKQPESTVPPGGIDILTVGPAFPGQHVGGIYIERSKFFTRTPPDNRSIRDRVDPGPVKTLWPHLDLHTYEVMSSALRTGNGIRRYHGFHAKIKESNDSIKVLEIREQSGAILTIPDIDLNDRTQCDDPDLLSTEIQDPDVPGKKENVLHAQSKPGDQGAVFLSLELCVQNSLSGPKEPPGAGADALIPGRRAELFPTRIMAVLNQQHAKVPARDRATDSSMPRQIGLASSALDMSGFKGIFVNVGVPDSDLFTKSVFERGFTNTNARRPVIATTGRLGLRSQLMEFMNSVEGDGNSLDIVADAPGGIQRIGNFSVDDARFALDAALVQLIRTRFARCRLLGCVTGLDLPARRRMLRLHSRLNIPVLGTLRAIAFPDFDDTSFQEFRKFGDDTVGCLI